MIFLNLQTKYKEDGKRSQTASFYSQLPQTSETQFAKSVSEIQSEVRIRDVRESAGDVEVTS